MMPSVDIAEESQLITDYSRNTQLRILAGK